MAHVWSTGIPDSGKFWEFQTIPAQPPLLSLPMVLTSPSLTLQIQSLCAVKPPATFQVAGKGLRLEGSGLKRRVKTRSSAFSKKMLTTNPLSQHFYTLTMGFKSHLINSQRKFLPYDLPQLTVAFEVSVKTSSLTHCYINLSPGAPW